MHVSHNVIVWKSIQETTSHWWVDVKDAIRGTHSQLHRGSYRTRSVDAGRANGAGDVNGNRCFAVVDVLLRRESLAPTPSRRSG